MPDKYFSRDEAEELLPLVEQSLVEARESREKVQDLDEQLSQASTKIMALGGSLPPYSKLSAQRTKREQFVAQLQEALDRLQDAGAVVKDLEQGLVDFPALREGKEIWLCWKLGEDRIRFWHGWEEGFAGRRPLDDEAAPPDLPSDSGRIQ